MTVSLAADILHYLPEELDSLAQHIQTTGGELTSPIMQVYEEDIRTPIKSVIKGTLIRGMLVQVQKAKVCLSVFFSFWGGSGTWEFYFVKSLFYSSFFLFPYPTV
jgi:hypothetical protein